MALFFSLCVDGVCTGASKNLQTGVAAAGLVTILKILTVGKLLVVTYSGFW